VTRFSACWARFQDKVGRMYQPCHDLANRDTILTVEDCYISVSLHILKKGFEREIWITKEVTLGLSVFVKRISWVGKHCKHLGRVKIIECLVHW